MFCYQCEQTAKGTGCTNSGICGKDADVSALQDLLIHTIKGISVFARKLRLNNYVNKELDIFIYEALFVTLTNVNFDKYSIKEYILKAYQWLIKIKSEYDKKASEKDILIPDTCKPSENISELINQGEKLSLENSITANGETIAGLIELITYGIKGIGAYAYHANRLGRSDNSISEFIYKAFSYFSSKEIAADTLLELALECGKVNLKVMEILDNANTSTFGHPVPTSVSIYPKKGKAILVSGHDLKDLEELLIQTANMGINIYTHGEMLPANAYPELKKYSHLAGNYGGAWQDQRKEFEEFPGAILMTTNCIQKPKDSYINRIFTCGPVAWENVSHIKNNDYKPVIDAALKEKGFDKDFDEKTIMTGFAHNTVLSIADKIINAVKEGKIKHFYLIGGCDGAKSGRNYYTEFAQNVPDDSVILTLACGKYRFNKLEFGDIEGIPRLLDIGQCNDAYSAIQIAIALANAFGTDVNGLPLSFILSWFEQKAVSILLTLLYLGIKDITLGPTLPAFISQDALNILIEKYNIKPISDAKKDLNATLS